MNSLREITNQTEWQEYLDKVEKFHSFFSAEWEEQVENYFSGWQFKHFIFQDNFLISVLVNNQGRAVSVPFFDVGSVLAIDYVKTINPDDLKRELKKTFGGDFKLTINCFYCQVISHLPSGLVDYVLSLREFPSFEVLDHNFRKTTKQEITKARVEIKNLTSEQELKKVYKIYLKNIRAKMNLVLPYNFFINWHRGEGEFKLAWLGNKIVGFSLFLRNKRLTHYYLNSSTTLGKERRAAFALLNQQIKNEFNQVDYLELGGTKIDSSLEVFKKGWGGKPYQIYTVSDSVVADNKPAGRSLWKFVPLCLLPFLSKILWKRFL